MCQSLCSCSCSRRSGLGPLLCQVSVFRVYAEEVVTSFAACRCHSFVQVDASVLSIAHGDFERGLMEGFQETARVGLQAHQQQASRQRTATTVVYVRARAHSRRRLLLVAIWIGSIEQSSEMQEIVQPPYRVRYVLRVARVFGTDVDLTAT